MESESTFAPVISYSNWGYWDCYGPPTPKDNPSNLVEDGDHIEIKWPDGTIEQSIVSMDHHSHEISDMGSPYTVHYHIAWAKVPRNGAEMNIQLNNTQVVVRRLRKDE